ncbi:alpha/beta hydrolase [Acetobacter oeni]|uniref:alpha/beta hydrolase n=1 Tax=Acetobacter oeni TaxID=304077 RepID=UPI00184794B1|nr:lysophospholipase [Acetobacter oeni]MBB3883934.1 alpha-beta hydrolase superfamily lysophospholipase [Acetobacter oeni]
MSSNHPHAFVSALFRVRRNGTSRLRIEAGRLCASFITLLLLSGCASEPVIHVPSRYASDARLIPPSRMLTLSDGAQIPVRIWPAIKPERGIILALHGFNDSRDAWEMTAPSLAAAGFTLWAPDLRGFGAAPDRGGWSGTKRMVQDTAEELTLIAKERPDMRLWLMGESMGGAVAMLTMSGYRGLYVERPRIAGTILLAPAVWNLGSGADIPLRLLAALAPNGRVTGRELPVRVTASDNISALRRLYFDPLTLHSTKLIALRGLVDLMSEAAGRSSDQSGPTLIVYGDHDQLIPADAMARAWRRLPATVRRDIIPGGHHLLLRDKARQRIASDILSWLLTPDVPLPSGGDVSAAAWASLHAATPHASGPTSAALPVLLPERMDSLLVK